MTSPSIETLKSSISLESVIGAVVELRNGKGLCPFHDDKNPSLSIKGRRFRCWACGESGDIVDFTKKYYGLSTGDAIKYLENRAGLKLNKPNSILIAEANERRELVEAFRNWEAERRNEMAEALRRCHRYRATNRGLFSEPELQELAYLQGEVDYLEYVYKEVLCGKDDRLKYEFFKEAKEAFGYGE